MKDIYILDNKDISYLEEVLLDENKRLKIVPYELLKDVPTEDLQLFGAKNACYSIPTQELIDFLKEEIGEAKAIEIGSGNGVAAEALAITATDNYEQVWPQIKELYDLYKQPVIRYGENVQLYDAMEAVSRYKPDAVVACWVTHKYNPAEPWREGNMYGVDEIKLFKKIKKYIFVGNEYTHRGKPILSVPHRTIKEEWIVSRSGEPGKNVIWIWEE